MNPTNNPLFSLADGACPLPSRRRARALPAHAGLAAAGLLLAALWLPPAFAASGPVEETLPRLEQRVRAGDPAALPALLAQRRHHGANAPYAQRIAWLTLLRQAQADKGDGAAADTAIEIERAALAEGDALNAALGSLGRIERLTATRPADALAALNALDARTNGLADPSFVAPLQQAYGDAYLALGQFDFALGHYLKALDLCRRHPGLLRPTPNMLRLSIAKLQVYTRAPGEVLDTLRQIGPDGGALAPSGAVRAAVIGGIAEGMRGRTAESLAAYARGLQIARAHDLPMLEASALANMADGYLQEHSWVKAENTAQAALRAAARAGDAHIARMATVNLGMALAGQGRVDEGLKRIDEAAAEMEAQQSWPDLANTLSEKSRMLEAAGRWRDALAALQRQQRIAARLTAAERENAVTVLQEQFNTQRRAVQIDGLRRENALKDEEIRKRRVWQAVASGGAAVALLLCALAWLLYRRSAQAARRLRALNEELAFHSTHDALTGLLNRRSFRDTMLARAGAGRSGDQCFILLDIDHFKAINDRMGHAAGDAVLVEVAQRLRAAAGERATVLRWGGEEFLVYADGLASGGHAALVRALLEAVSAAPIAAVEDLQATVTISAGALSLPVIGAAPFDWQQALAVADHALYRAKDAGRNRGYLADGRLARAGVAGLRLEPVLPHWFGAGAPLCA
jgi:diguanylate cyclase (GGDEF)-like protein